MISGVSDQASQPLHPETRFHFPSRANILSDDLVLTGQKSGPDTIALTRDLEALARPLDVLKTAP